MKTMTEQTQTPALGATITAWCADPVLQQRDDGTQTVLMVNKKRVPSWTVQSYEAKRTQLHMTVTTSDGAHAVKRFPLGTWFEISRDATEAEQAEADERYAAMTLAEVRKELVDPTRKLRAVVTDVIEKLSKDSDRPTSVLQWHTADVAEAEAMAHCWAQIKNMVERNGDTDTVLLQALLYMEREVRSDIVRAARGSSRSTSAYSNAIEADALHGKVKWLEHWTVVQALHVAQQRGVVLPD